MLTRRHFLASGALVAAALLAPRWLRRGQDDGGTGAFPFELDDDEWLARLTTDQYAVLRRHATETPYTSPLLDEGRVGTYACAGCDQDLFASSTKYDSRTGWPSFWAPLPGATGTAEDRSLGMVRTEVHCSRCGGHLGHVFEDGPPPTGERWCINGVALTFTPSAT